MLAHLIINPNSGPKSTSVQIENELSTLSQKGVDVEKFISRSTADAEEFTIKAVKQKVDLVIVAGGDGTINEIAEHLAGTSIPLAVIPTGTANVFANELKIPTRKLLKSSYIHEAIAVIINGSIKEIDLGKVKFQDGLSKYFVMWCGIGLDAKLTEAKKTPPSNFFWENNKLF